MNEVIAIFSIMALLAAGLTNIAIWARRRLWLKLTALATLVSFLPVAYYAVSELLSRPKPIAMEWTKRDLTEATVLGSQVIENEAIYVWLSVEDSKEPRAYVLPWSEEMARQLHGAKRRAEQDGSDLMMGQPFEASLDSQDRLFYPAPPAPSPLKAQTAQKPQVFRPSQSIQDLRQ